MDRHTGPINTNHDGVRARSTPASSCVAFALTVAYDGDLDFNQGEAVMKVLMATLIALSVLATLPASGSATTGKISKELQEQLKNCFPASECQPS